MSKSQIKEALRQQSLEWYLTKSDSNYFTAPELFSPLYRVLYEHLLRGEEPPYYVTDFDKETTANLHQCRTSFDRYLVALFPSRYEASNSLELRSTELKEGELLEYLHSTYAKATSDRDSYNTDREIKYILDLLPITEDKVEWLKKKAKSQLYKLLVLSYKLSIINPRWRELIRYVEPERMHKASMDNVVDFNMLDDTKARENSALVKMFYFEIDQGKGDGDATQSRRIMILPFAFDCLFKAVQLTAYRQFYLGQNLDQIEEKLKSFSTRFDSILHGLSKQPLSYKNHNQELADLMQTTVLKNIYTNGLLARKCFEHNIDYCEVKIANNGNWIINTQGTLNIPRLIESELNLPSGTFDPRWVALAETLAKVVLKSDRIAPEEYHVIRNLCCILVTHLKKQGKVNLKSNITGKKHNDFSVMKELVRGHDWLQKNDPNVENKHHLSLMRPTTVHFLTYAVGQLMWSMDCGQHSEQSNLSDSDYVQFSTTVFDTVFELIIKLRSADHVTCLSAVEYMCKEIYGVHFDLDQRFLASLGDKLVLQKHIERAQIVWDPLKNL
ncbi:hypothetical protein RG677_003033 [Vibrio parahaemolyticus]|uniref:hypothetical protein n=2 Tax=Vibrio parahaemolyticus TaxID=670 RepID=UPI001299BA96|nr:hypothetical protein [Vibrio parahaemolyticus]EJB8572383.1 hypothetical protein [Vibrio parahaemolyticus]ELB2951572.1 hypothetical protein [Vibrio parahaemolyticus]MCZ6382177.1 hypothetical protein [Vibrio parahaemolyticus]MRD95457.1 hypothetical protein [Vibrio parahaemolyticus]